MKNLPEEELCSAVVELLTTLNFTSVFMVQDNWEHLVRDDLICVWEYLLKYCRPSHEICEIKKLLTKMTKQQEIKNYKKKVHLRKVLAQKKKLNLRSEKDVFKLITKYSQADNEIIDSWKAVTEVENKAFILHCKALEIERELKLCEENCNFVGGYVCNQETDSRKEGVSLLSRVSEVLDTIKKLVLGKKDVTNEKDQLIEDALCKSVGKMLCRDTDSANVWHTVLSILDETCHQVEHLQEGSHSESLMSSGSVGLETLSNFHVQFVQLFKRVSSLENDLPESDRICVLKNASAKLLKNWFLMHHPCDSDSFGSTVEDFVELSVRYEQMASIRQSYLSVRRDFNEDVLSLMTADIKKIIEQRNDSLHKNVECQSYLNDILDQCFSLIHDVRWLTCNSSVKLSQNFSKLADLSVLKRLAEEIFSLWMNELEIFSASPLQILTGITLCREELVPRLLCPMSLRMSWPAGYCSEKLSAVCGGLLLLPPEVSLTKLANTLAFERKLQHASKLSSLPSISVAEEKFKEENILSTNTEKLAHISHSLGELVDSFKEIDTNLLFWVSQPLSSVAKTMVVNGRKFEEFQQARNMSSLSKSSSVHSGLNKMTSFSTSFRKRTDSFGSEN